MAARGFCLTKIRVRFPALHPFLFILLALALCCGRGSAADVGDVAHYSAAPDTLAAAVASPESLARVVGGDIFGVYWSTFGGNGQITAIDGVSMRDRADGVQELATVTFSTFKGVEKAIAEAAASDPLVLDWLEQIYDQLYTSSRSGDVVTKTSIADLIASRSWINSSPIFVPGNGWVKDLDVPNLLAAINRQLYNDLQMSFAVPTLMPNGLEYGNNQYTAVEILNFGFRGLGQLLFGATDHPIYGLGRNGLAETGQRGSWSLADITANGMLGLGHLIAGDYPDGREYFWTWTDPSDPSHVLSHNVSSLFDLFFEIQTLQSSLAKLEYVYASQEDIDFKEQEEPNMYAVKDAFFGDGEGAVNPDQIKDVAGISSAAKDAFKSDVSPGDVFTAISDSNSYWFFTQPVADALDTVNAPAVAAVDDDDFLDQFVLGDDGFYEPDLSPWSLSDYLGG